MATVLHLKGEPARTEARSIQARTSERPHNNQKQSNNSDRFESQKQSLSLMKKETNNIANDFNNDGFGKKNSNQKVKKEIVVRRTSETSCSST